MYHMVGGLFCFFFPPASKSGEFSVRYTAAVTRVGARAAQAQLRCGESVGYVYRSLSGAKFRIGL